MSQNKAVWVSFIDDEIGEPILYPGYSIINRQLKKKKTVRMINEEGELDKCENIDAQDVITNFEDIDALPIPEVIKRELRERSLYEISLLPTLHKKFKSWAKIIRMTRTLHGAYFPEIDAVGMKASSSGLQKTNVASSSRLQTTNVESSRLITLDQLRNELDKLLPRTLGSTLEKKKVLLDIANTLAENLTKEDIKHIIDDIIHLEPDCELVADTAKPGDLSKKNAGTNKRETIAYQCSWCNEIGTKTMRNKHALEHTSKGHTKADYRIHHSFTLTCPCQCLVQNITKNHINQDHRYRHDFFPDPKPGYCPLMCPRTYRKEDTKKSHIEQHVLDQGSIILTTMDEVLEFLDDDDSAVESDDLKGVS